MRTNSALFVNCAPLAAYSLASVAAQVEACKRAGERVVFTNGCFDILHAGHAGLLEQARALGDFLVVGLNSDASVRRLKGPSRPIHDQEARARVLAALRAVDAVVIFEEDTPVETIAALAPHIHVKGGDYTPEALPETAVVRAGGGEVVILPLVDGYSTTRAVNLSASAVPAHIVIPARFGSTRFPGKPLADLGGKPVIVRVVEAALATSAARPILVATDDQRIFTAVEGAFAPDQARPVMTSPTCHTGTDRLAEAVRGHILGDDPSASGRAIVVNLQGDEPFVAAEHVSRLIEVMRASPALRMATLATPIIQEEQIHDPNVVKVTVDGRGRALYFSRATIPYDREKVGIRPLRHLGIYAYEANWLLEMAALPPSRLEEIEKLEQLRALEHGVGIGVAVVEGAVPIAIDTPADLARAQAYWAEQGFAR